MTNSLPIHHESVDADTPRIKLQEYKQPTDLSIKHVHQVDMILMK